MKKDEFDIVYNAEVQRLLISHLIEDPDIFVRCQSIIKDEYFDDQLRRAVRFILLHADEHKALPSPALIQAKTGVEVRKLSEYGTAMNQDWFMDEIVQFCRYRAIENLLLEGIDLLQKNAFSTIETRLKDALTISLVSDLGLDYFEDPATRLNRMLDKSAMISTGWKTMDDKLYGGFTRGGLNVFAGQSGVGKSLFLQNQALNWVLMGYDVVYFSLELGEELVALRIDSMLSGLGTKQVLSSVGDTSLMITMKGKKAGRLAIKKMPEGSTTTNHLRAYLKEYQIKTGIKPDAIVIDYLDLMYPNNAKIDVSSLFVKDKFVSEEIREMMHETNTFGSTASQLNRQSFESEGEFAQNHIAGGLSKINTSDVVAAINAPPFMKERGEIELIFLKTRSAAAVGQRIKLSYNPSSMRISDLSDMDFVPKDAEKPLAREELKNSLITPISPVVSVSEIEKNEDNIDMMTDKAPLTALAKLMMKQRSGKELL